MKTTRWTAVIVSALTLTMGACARNATLQPERAEREVSRARRPVIVTITNNHYADMRIYAVSESGAQFRVGTAGGLSSTTLVLPTSMFGTGTLRLVALPIGGGGSAESGLLMVNGARSVGFTIQQHLPASYGFTR